MSKLSDIFISKKVDDTKKTLKIEYNILELLKKAQEAGSKSPEKDKYTLSTNHFQNHISTSINKSKLKYDELDKKIHAKGAEDHYELKKEWSKKILGLMSGMVAFQMFIILGVGLKIFDYTEYDWLLPTLMIQYLTQIVGLAWIIVNSLYKKIN